MTRLPLLLALLPLLAGVAPAQSQSQSPTTPADPLPKLHVQGRHLVNPNGQPVVLQGVNLGNWFLLEAWMFDLDTEQFPDQHTIHTTLEQRFGQARAQQLLDLHRQTWITADDFQQLAGFGFNAVRLPVHYSVVEKIDGDQTTYDFRWLDHALQLATDAGVYVILDLHGTPGGQSVDQPSGRVGENNLWTDPTAQQRTVDLWAQLAKRYANHQNVAAYDLINEPYGDMQQDLRPIIVPLIDRILQAVRQHDPHTLAYVPGTLQGITFYGNPADHGWTHTGFTEHYYRGLFGDIDDLAAHLDQLGPVFEQKQAFFKIADAPFLLGEFNPVFHHTGGPALTRAYFDRTEELGWAATLWAYKRVLQNPDPQGDGWALVTNQQLTQPLDLHHDDYDTLQQKLRSYQLHQPESLGLLQNQELHAALTAEQAPVDFPLLDPHQTNTNPSADPAPWAFHTVGHPQPASAHRPSDSPETLQLAFHGQDIFNAQDHFTFLQQPADHGDLTLATIVHDFHAPGRFAKAGLMLRASLEPDAPHVLLHVFPNGQLSLAQRNTKAGPTTEQRLGVARFPVGLALQRNGQQLQFFATDEHDQWQTVATLQPDFLKTSTPHLGLALSANDHERPGHATVQSLTLQPTTKPNAFPPLQYPRQHADQKLRLRNADFNAGSQHWHTWNHAALRFDANPNRRNQDDPAVYFQPSTDPNQPSTQAGLWQDLAHPRPPGTPLTLQLLAKTQPPNDNTPPLQGTLELRLETPPLNPDHPQPTRIVLARTTVNLEHLNPNHRWTPLTLQAPAFDQSLRVVISIDANQPIALDDIALTHAPLPTETDPAQP